jgi:hypothetical protein
MTIINSTRTALAGATAGLLLLCACQTQPAAVLDDHPEPGLQGQVMAGDARILPNPYHQGVRLIGHSPILNRDSNVQLSWIDQCAYVSSSVPGLIQGPKTDPATAGVAVIDVSDPAAPKLVRLLRDHGSLNSVETMHAVTARDRKVLVAGAYAGGNPQFGPNDLPWLDIYDAADCTNPRLMAEVQWPENVHTITISANGRRVYGTHIEPFSGHGGIHVMDISDLVHPRYLGKFGATAADGKSWEFAPHELSISADERRLYVGVIGSRGGDLNRHIQGPEGFSMDRVAPDAGGIYILDNSDIVDGRADPRLRLIGTAQHGGWHSVMRANIGGVPYLVGGGELSPCPGAFPMLVNIADESRPYIAGEFRLAMNHQEKCNRPPAGAAGIMPGGEQSATLHFNDVDSAEHTRLGLFNFTYAGLRIADIRDPLHPVELAYFRPGDFCTGHVRYFPKAAQIWSVCAASGFHVIELAPEVRARLRSR